MNDTPEAVRHFDAATAARVNATNRITQLEHENAKLRAAIEDMRTTTQGYLSGAEWEHWKHYHAERFALALKS